MNAATELMHIKEYAAAKVKIEAVIAVNPWSENGLNISGEAKRELGDVDSAIKDYAAAMEIGGSSYPLQFALQAAGLLQGEVTGDLDEATRQALPKCIRDEKCYAALKRF